MKITFIAGLIMFAVTVVGCSQLQSPTTVQASQLVQPGLSAAPIESIAPTTQLDASAELSPLFKVILTPSTQTVDSEIAENTSLEEEHPSSGLTPTAIQGSPIPVVPSSMATPEHTPVDKTTDIESVQSTTPPLGAAIGSGIPDLLLSSSESVLAVGQSLDIRLLLTSAPTGVSGFIVDLEIVDTAVAEIATSDFPNFSLGIASALPAASAELQAVDLSQEVNASANEVVLSIAGIRGLAAGTTEITVLVRRMDDDDGLPISTNTQSFTLTVH